ncbi:double-stranded RNA-binding protein 3-like [Phoenix dactylifera]|uniref:Double-stranded RNA-binding protein 3-like n=1 Tax=Phoenix dactylifera TaxID=42345 RepID=A0A8B9AR78_PHODC|nr:double-stranded RNA-binding protein 3-like [Phoenix dactylifera]XP_038985824.1 double-stranded RNA-binding protein 3-like [Phoenix dactylifera]XP_038985825.1 double-stranded RNA-binding protein 3-like [Phoenix dactylifera]
MYKNQLQELAQRSCFNLPSYACIREGPDHAPRFKASVNFNGEIFEGPSNCTTLRQAEHAAAEVALTNLSTRGPSRSLAARVLDETGVYKNLLQETAHRAGLKLPVYTTVRSGPGHLPVFTCSVELAGMSFTGEPAKTKKQAEKNAAMAAWSALKQMPDLGSSSQQAKEKESSEEQEEVVVTRVLSNLRPKEESKPMRHRNQQHQRSRLMLVSREGTSAASFNSLGFQHKWKSMDPLCPQQQRCFLSPPPSTGPKILPPMPLLQHSSTTSQEPAFSKDKSNSLPPYPSNRPLPPPQLEEKKQKDEEEQINGNSLAKPTPSYTPMPAYRRAFPMSNTSVANRMVDQRIQQTQMSSRPFGSSASTGTAPARSLHRIPIPAIFSGGGYHAPGVAPAVHIRSVIPVCAAPPMRPAVNTTAVQKKEGEISAATSKLNRLHL